jgi:hypothetical protein
MDTNSSSVSSLEKLEESKEGNSKSTQSNIPLPSSGKDSEGTVQARLKSFISRLHTAGVCSSTQMKSWSSHPGNPHVTREILQAWSDWDREGHRLPNSSAFKCIKPDAEKDPNATSTSFRLDNFIMMLGEDLPDVRDYLHKSFSEGFVRTEAKFNGTGN